MQKNYTMQSIIMDIDSTKKDIEAIELLSGLVQGSPEATDMLVRAIGAKKPLEVECRLNSTANMLREHLATLEHIMATTSVKWPPDVVIQ